jgi:hypothetical protein
MDSFESKLEEMFQYLLNLNKSVHKNTPTGEQVQNLMQQIQHNVNLNNQGGLPSQPLPNPRGEMPPRTNPSGAGPSSHGKQSA